MLSGTQEDIEGWTMWYWLCCCELGEWHCFFESPASQLFF